MTPLRQPCRAHAAGGGRRSPGGWHRCRPGISMLSARLESLSWLRGARRRQDPGCRRPLPALACCHGCSPKDCRRCCSSTRPPAGSCPPMVWRNNPPLGRLCPRPPRPGRTRPACATRWAGLSVTGHPRSRAAYGAPVSGQSISAPRASDSTGARKALFVLGLPLEGAPALHGHALVVLGRCPRSRPIRSLATPQRIGWHEPHAGGRIPACRAGQSGRRQLVGCVRSARRRHRDRGGRCDAARPRCRGGHGAAA